MVVEVDPWAKIGLRSALFYQYHIVVTKFDTIYDPATFATLVRFMVMRNPGEAEIGGCKYVAFHLDTYRVSNLSERIDMLSDLVLSVWASFKHDQVMRIWGMPMPHMRTPIPKYVEFEGEPCS